MWYRSLMLTALLAGCGGGESVYCVAQVRAEDQGQGVQDQCFYNPDLVGETICCGDRVTASFCDDLDGTSGSLDVYENGPEKYCSEEGFSVACNSVLFMPSADACPGDNGLDTGTDAAE